MAGWGASGSGRIGCWSVFGWSVRGWCDAGALVSALVTVLGDGFGQGSAGRLPAGLVNGVGCRPRGSGEGGERADAGERAVDGGAGGVPRQADQGFRPSGASDFGCLLTTASQQ